MNWADVPAYQRPLEKREDTGLAMPYKWSPWMRRVWQIHVEMALPINYQRIMRTTERKENRP